MLLLLEELKAGRRPDITVFCDGINDTNVGAVTPDAPAPHYSFQRIKGRFEGRFASGLILLDKSYLLRLTIDVVRRLRSKHVSQRPLDRAAAEPILLNYEGNLRVIRALADAYGFKACFFWQPALLYGNKPLTPSEKRSVAESQEDATLPPVRMVYEAARRRSEASGDFVFLGNMFDHVPEPIYIDWVHLGPRGNQLLAQAIGERIRPLYRPAGKQQLYLKMVQ